MSRQLNILLITAFLLVSLNTLAGSNDQLKRPISLDKIEPGDLYALDASGAVFRLAVSNSGLAVKGGFRLPPFAYPADLVSAQLFNQLTLLITTNNQKSGFVSQYSLDGKLQHLWSFRYGVAGLDVDYKSHIVYVSSSYAPEVYEINLQAAGQTSPGFSGTVVGARQLGPLVVDMRKGRLLLGDLEAGQVFEFDLKSKKSRVFVSNLGSPQALLLSDDSTALYIADGSRKKIYVCDLNSATQTPKVFAALPGFRNPAGLARLGDGRIVVADDEAGSLFVLSKTGQLQSTFRQ
jgi:DNA-binding beta-propeller fold protein YncE